VVGLWLRYRVGSQNHCLSLTAAGFLYRRRCIYVTVDCFNLVRFWLEIVLYLLLLYRVVGLSFCCRVDGRTLSPFLKRCFVSSFMLASLAFSLIY
jgi:hypothetical protein